MDAKSQAQRWTRWLGSLGLNLALAVLFTFFLFPIYWVVTMSFKRIEDILAWPPRFRFTPTLENYVSIFKSEIEVKGQGAISIDFLPALTHTLVISLGAVLIAILLGVPAAYALARFKFKGREDMAFTFLSFRFGPELLVVIPIYFIFQRIGLVGTYTGLIWVYQLITMPMIIWIVRSYVEDIPVAFEEACMVDGYDRWRAAIKVVLKLIRPGVAAAGLLAFIYAWNNFAFSLILGSKETSTITLSAMKFVSAEAVRYGIMSAGIVVSFVPIMLVSIFAQRSFVRGLSMGAIKR